MEWIEAEPDDHLPDDLAHNHNKVGVSARTIRRWLRRYQRRGDVTGLLPAPRGVRLGQRSLDPSVKELKADPEVLPPEVGHRTRLLRGSAEAARVLARVEIDHTLVDTHIVDAKDRGPLGRPYEQFLRNRIGSSAVAHPSACANSTATSWGHCSRKLLTPI
jgi:hypothetical protein